jgi:small subunit ribosomal protein S19e
MIIGKLAEYLKENVDEITPPEWASIVKTGTHSQRQPENPDWWYIRCASILRKIYRHGPMGIEKLRAKYGGRKDYGHRPEHVTKGSGKILRTALQQLETAGFLDKRERKGRQITKKGRKILEEIADETKKQAIKMVPALKKYQ